MLDTQLLHRITQIETTTGDLGFDSCKFRKMQMVFLRER